MKVRGFTLVEVLATTALVALLMFVGLRVLASLGRTRAEMAARAAAPADASGIVEMIRWDLANARYVKSGPDGFSLAGYCGVEAIDFSPRHRPVAVTYFLRLAGGRRWLVRRQADLDDPSNGRGWSELVGPDVASITLLRADGDPVNTRGVGSRGATPAGLADTSSSGEERPWMGPAIGLVRPRGYMPVPPRVRLAVRPSTASGPRADELICVW